MTEIFALIKLLLLPPMVLPVLAVILLVFFQKRKLPVVTVCLSLFLILSLPVVANKIAKSLEYFPPLQPERIQQFLPQAIVVLGAGLERSGLEYGNNVTIKSGTLLRVRYAARLARLTGLPVLASGGRTLGDKDVSEAELMASVLRDEFGIPVVWMEMTSLNTAENARLTRQTLQQLGIGKILLVTQAYHMPRAEKEFRKAGFQVLPAPTSFIGRDAAGSALSDWIPSVKALEHIFLLAHECVGMLWYRLRY